MGIIVLGGLLIYIFCCLVVLVFVHRYFESIVVTTFMIILAVLIPTYDIIITNYLGHRMCNADPNPKTFFKKTVEYPESIYWEDNVYPGFNKEDRELMIINYLDGIHLKKMALNGDDGKIYMYEAISGMWNQVDKWERTHKKLLNQIVKTKDKHKKEKLIEINKKALTNKNKAANDAIELILQNVQIFNSPSEVPADYTVKYDNVPLSEFTAQFIYSDQMEVVENKTSEIIAFNQRVMHRFYHLLPDAAGGRYYYPHSMCGDNSYNAFDDEVFVQLKFINGSNDNHNYGINQMLYIRKGGKK